MARQKNKPKTPLAARLSEIRERTGLEREEFADKIGISKQGLGNYERGDRIPKATVLAAYVRVCDVSSHWLTTGEGDIFDDRTERPRPLSAKDTEKAYLQKAVKAVETGLAGAHVTHNKKAELIDLARALFKEGKAEYLRKIITLLLTR